MKRWIYILYSFFLSFCVSANVQKEHSIIHGSPDPYLAVQSMTDEAFARFKKDQNIIKKNPDHLKVIIREEIVPYFDDRYAAYKVLGNKHLKQTNAEQRDRFVDAFSEYMVTLLAQSFAAYSNQQYKVIKDDVVRKEKLSTVPMKILDYNKPPINVKFKVRRTKKGYWLVFDVVVENISILVSKQSEITQLLRDNKGNINVVIELLKEKAGTNIVIDKSQEKK